MSKSGASQITYKRTKKLPLDQVEHLWRVVGWWSDATPPYLLPPALARSHSLVSAWDGEALVGLANALSDGLVEVYYPYVLVDPAYQRQGIGARLMAIMLRRYQNMRHQVLLAVNEAVPFYEKVGLVEPEHGRAMWIDKRS